jgi:hypothetical protein
MRLASRVVTPLGLELILQTPLAQLVAAERAVSVPTNPNLSCAYTVPEFAHGKVDPVEAGKKGGNS